MSIFELVKAMLLPGTLSFLLLGLTLGLAALLLLRTRRFGLVVLVAMTAAYWVMSMPAGALLLGRLVSAGYSPVADLSVIAGVQAIVVLDGGAASYSRESEELVVVRSSSAIRALEAARLYRALQPKLVIVTAGTHRRVGKMPPGWAIREVLLVAGVPFDRIVLDSASRSTREHAANVSALLQSAGITEFALVTSAVHMRRAVRNFIEAGTKPIPAPAPLEPPEPFYWLPNLAALNRSQAAWYEVFGSFRDSVLRAFM